MNVYSEIPRYGRLANIPVLSKKSKGLPGYRARRHSPTRYSGYPAFACHSAQDVISRWVVLEVHRQATSFTAAHFLHALEERMPLLVKAFQVDGGSEFEAAFEEECQKRNISLFVLPPNSLKLNGHAERAHLTHTEEFYEVTDSPFNGGAEPDKSSNYKNARN